MEIKARDRTYMALQYFGQQLLQSKHFGSDKVRDRMQEVAGNREALTEVWMIHGVKLEQSYDLQQFEGECEQAESLMAEMEASLRRKVDGGGVASLLKKQIESDETVDKQDKDIEALRHFAAQLIANNHYDAGRIDGKRWFKVKSNILNYCAELGETESQGQFAHDEDEMKTSVQENLQTLINESDKDQPNIQAKHLKSFGAEPTENTDTIQNIIKMKEKPDENQVCPGSEDSVLRHNRKPLKDWEHLTSNSREKHEKFEEASRQWMYLTKVELPKLCICFAILLFHIGVASSLDMNASYSTSFRCADGSYAFITGDTLTLEFTYGYRFTELQSFHLYDMLNFRHMLDYERKANQTYIKDRKNRLKSYVWTDTGIKLTIPDIDKEKDVGTYKALVDIGGDHQEQTIEINKIYDPPSMVNITLAEDTIYLKKGFGEYTFYTSAEPYGGITCRGVTITWVSPTNGNLTICEAEDERNSTACPLTLKESEMTVDKCTTVMAYAEQYGVRSDNKTKTVCFQGTKEQAVSEEEPCKEVIIGMSICIFLLVIVIIIMAVCLKKRSKNEESVNAWYSPARQGVQFGHRQRSALKGMYRKLSSNTKACCSDAESENE